MFRKSILWLATSWLIVSLARVAQVGLSTMPVRDVTLLETLTDPSVLVVVLGVGVVRDLAFLSLMIGPWPLLARVFPPVERSWAALFLGSFALATVLACLLVYGIARPSSRCALLSPASFLGAAMQHIVLIVLGFLGSRALLRGMQPGAYLQSGGS